MIDPVAIVLAAGKSTRMKSDVPKVIHEVCGRPMIEYVLDALRAAGVKRTVVVVGHKAELVRAALEHHPDVEFALQAEQRGTGHAVMVCADNIAGHDGPLLVVAGDTPLLRADSLRGLLLEQHNHKAACVIGSARTANNEGLGRIVRDKQGEFDRIVEQRDATPEIALIQEVNTGCYAFDCRALFEALKRIQPTNVQGEYYLTDCAQVLRELGRTVLASDKLEIVEAMGVNTRAQLAGVADVVQKRTLEKLMAEGVTIVAPQQTYIDPRVTIGPDTVVHPFTTIEGAVTIGRGCRIGPHASLRAPATIAEGTTIAPFQRLGSD